MRYLKGACPVLLIALVVLIIGGYLFLFRTKINQDENGFFKYYYAWGKINKIDYLTVERVLKTRFYVPEYIVRPNEDMHWPIMLCIEYDTNADGKLDARARWAYKEDLFDLEINIDKPEKDQKVLGGEEAEKRLKEIQKKVFTENQGEKPK